MLILSAINPEQALSDDEAELMELDLAAVAAGSTEALERLYNTAKAAVYSYSLSVLRNVQDAEDVLHDCFVNIFTAAAGYRPHGKPMAWIITIAKNLCFARLRQHNRQEQLPDEDWSEMLADNAGLSNEDRLVLRECLGRLSEEENRIVVLHAVAWFTLRLQKTERKSHTHEKEKLSQKHHCGGSRGSVRACRRYRLRHISKGKQSRFNRCAGR